MAISDNYVPTNVQGNGVTDDFTANWNVISEDFINVVLEDRTTGVQTTQTITTDFTLVFNSTSLTVTFVTPPPSTDNVIIGRDVTQDQTDPFKTSRGFDGLVIENNLDKITAIAQDQQDELNRTPKLALGSPTSSVTLPEPEADLILAWDGVLGAIKNVTAADAGVVAFPSVTVDNAFIRSDGIDGQAYQTAQMQEDDAGNITVAGNIELAVGTAGAPSLNFTGDATTGFYRNASGEIAFSSAGVAQFKFTNGTIEPVTTNDIDLGTASLKYKDAFIDGTAIIGDITVDLGSAAAPSINFTTDTTTGFYRNATGEAAFTSAGVAQVKFTNGTIEPVTTNDIDLGTASLKFKDAFINGILTAGSLALTTDLPITEGGTGSSTASDAVDALGGASSSGSGGLVRITSPTLVTPVLGAATATSIGFGNEVLDEYDEGTWTPAYDDSASAGTWNHSTQVGNYVRVGNLCLCWGTLATSSTTAAAANNMRITGFPFTAVNTSAVFFTGSIGVTQGFSATTNPRGLYMADNSAFAEMIVNKNTDPRDELDVNLVETGMGAVTNTMRFFVAFQVA